MGEIRKTLKYSFLHRFDTQGCKNYRKVPNPKFPYGLQYLLRTTLIYRENTFKMPLIHQ